MKLILIVAILIGLTACGIQGGSGRQITESVHPYRSEVDEYGVVCYRYYTGNETLSCVKVK
jgi:hypothetical protein